AVTQCQNVLIGPVCGKIFSSSHGTIVIEQPNPEGWERTDTSPRPTIGATHFQEAFKTYVGKKCREMVCPVSHRWLPVRYFTLEGTIHELAKGDMRAVMIGVVAHDEIHRHVHRPVDIILEAEIRLEDEGQEA